MPAYAYLCNSKKQNQIGGTMKKIIGIVLLLLATVLLGGPFYAGIKAEKELRNFTAKFDSYPGYQVSWQTYKRGWFSTEAVLDIGLDAAMWPSADDVPVEPLPTLPLAIQIDHGPLLLNDISSLGWYSWQLDLTKNQTEWLEEHVDMAGEGQLYEARGHAGLLGAVTFDDELKAFAISDDHGNILLRTNGYVGAGTISSAGKLSYAGLVKGIDLTAEDALVVLGDITLRTEGDLSRMDWDSFIYPSHFYANLASVQAQGGDQEVSLTNTVFEGAIEIPEGESWFDLIVSLSVGSLAAHDVQIDDATMTFAYEHISLQAYSAYMDMVAATLESPEQDLNYQQFLTPEVMQEFFANGPAFALRNFSFTMPDGDFKGSIKLALKDDFTMPASEPNLFMLIQALTLDADVVVDRSLALYLAKTSSRAQAEASMVDSEVTEADIEAAANQQAQDKLGMLTAQGILVSEGETLRARLQFADGQLLLNGKPMPLPLGMLMGGLQAQADDGGQEL
jgi:uncharacterized protein YdgA (DUF945 family)